MLPWPCMSVRGQVIIKNPVEKNSILGIMPVFWSLKKKSIYVDENPLWEKFSGKCQSLYCKNKLFELQGA